MSAVQEKKERIIYAINNLSEDKLLIVENLIDTITKEDKLPLDHIYKKAVEKYHETLQKLAQ